MKKRLKRLSPKDRKRFEKLSVDSTAYGLHPRQYFLDAIKRLNEIMGNRYSHKDVRDSALENLMECYLRCDLKEGDFNLFDIAIANYSFREPYFLLCGN